MESIIHDLAMLYMGQQDLSGLSPEELYEKYVDAYQRIQRKHDESAPKVPPAKARVINRGI